MRSTRSAAAALFLSLCASLLPFPGGAQTAATPARIENSLSSQYSLTKTTADRSDIVTAGAVLVLKKDGLLMSSTATATPAQNTYKDGRITQGVWKMAKMPGFGSLMSHTGQTAQTRTFVAGEKFWVTKITVHEDGIVFDLFSDPISDVRYYSSLKFPFPKGAYPAPEQAASTVGEVLQVQPADNSAGAGDQGQQQPANGAPAGAPAPAAAAVAAQAPATSPTAMAPIAPPPPPTDAPPAAPKTIALKQTREQVVAMFGQPTKVVKLGTKEIDYYPDMKVTFVNDKVTDVQ